MRERTQLAGLTAIAAVVLLPSSLTRGSTQDFMGISKGYGANAQIELTRISYISSPAAPGMIRNFDPRPQSYYMINNVFVARSDFLSAVTPGKRMYCRGNRKKGMFFALYTTPPYAAHGIIESVSEKRVSVQHQICFTQCVAHFAKQTFQVPDGAVVRYEGRDATLADALEAGRFVRFIAPRKQIVQAISSSVRLRADQVEVTIDNGRRPREGHLAGMDGRDLLMAEQIPGGCRDIRVSADKDVSGQAWLLDGQFTPRGAALRVGDRTLACPDGFISVDSYRTFQIPGDEGIVEGAVKSFDDAQLVVTTHTSPTGKAVDCVAKDVTVRVDPDALIDINGLKGFATINRGLQQHNKTTLLAYTVIDVSKETTLKVNAPFTQSGRVQMVVAGVPVAHRQIVQLQEGLYPVLVAVRLRTNWTTLDTGFSAASDEEVRAAQEYTAELANRYGPMQGSSMPLLPAKSIILPAQMHSTIMPLLPKDFRRFFHG